MKLQPVLFGLLAGIAGVVLLVIYMRRFEEEVAGGRRISLIVAVSPIARGKPISADMLGTRDVPIAYADDRSIRVGERDKILGLHATSNIPVQQTLSWTDVIAINDDQRALSALVQPGNRAMPIKVSFDEEIPLIRPGDFVDVLAVYSDTRAASVVLQRVLVLASGRDTSNDPAAEKHVSNGGLKATTITLSVSLAEGQLLALAMQRGSLTVVVRNPTDQTVAEAPPDLSPSTLNDLKQHPVVAAGHRGGPGGVPIKLEAEKPR
jgi:pilus assembly protein CpaB